MFFKGSRYETVEDAQYTDRQGRTFIYKRVRWIPDTPAQVSHTTRLGERLDHIAHQYYRDPERFWRICDANQTMKPEDLVAEVGQSILIPPARG